ncbi:MAG: polysaccharide deacetylase family protein [Spirochaetota bacterium]
MQKMPVLILSFFLVAASLPAVDTLELNAVRTWESPTPQESPIPLRDDPQIVVLLYHNLVFGRPGNVYNRDIYNFEHDLAFIRRNFEVIDLYELEDIRTGKRGLQTDAAVITFDDGDLSNYALAYPILLEFDMKATFFLVPSFVGNTGYMNWRQIREMEAVTNTSGERLFTFGSHTMNHKMLGNSTYEQVITELTVSKAVLNEQLRHPVEFLALPYGSGAGDPLIIQSAQESGYSIVRSSLPQAIAPEQLDSYNLPAFNVDSASTDIFVKRILTMLGR